MNDHDKIQSRVGHAAVPVNVHHEKGREPTDARTGAREMNLHDAVTALMSRLTPWQAAALTEALVGGLQAAVLGRYPRDCIAVIEGVSRVAEWRAAGRRPVSAVGNVSGLRSIRSAPSVRDEWVSARGLADLLGLTPRRIGQIATELGFEKFDGRWWFTREQAEIIIQYQQERAA